MHDVSILPPKTVKGQAVAGSFFDNPNEVPYTECRIRPAGKMFR